MAKNKEEENIDDPDAKKRLQEKQEREKAEKKAHEIKRKEKEAKRKARQKRIKHKENKEKDRIKLLTSFPYNFLAQISAIISILCFMILYFLNSNTLSSSLIYSFILFTSLYLSVGIVMMVIFFIVSEQKKRENEEKRIQEEEQKRLDEERKAQEQAQLEENLKEEYKNQQEAMHARNLYERELESQYENENYEANSLTTTSPIITPPPTETADMYGELDIEEENI
jgi:hypothetical protein